MSNQSYLLHGFRFSSFEDLVLVIRTKQLHPTYTWRQVIFLMIHVYEDKLSIINWDGNIE